MAVYTSYQEIIRRKATSGKENEQMQYLVQMKLVPQARPVTTEEGEAFIEQYIFPTLERCKKLQDEKEILAGGR